MAHCDAVSGEGIHPINSGKGQDRIIRKWGNGVPFEPIGFSA
ncbi:hypothetical protein RKLH11_890 [Rhodobacteraceae bacterium KLH11]|nr:hypothetical protein RKLH11_890 [Rhodobacteraceae bacterium KLH11]